MNIDNDLIITFVLYWYGVTMYFLVLTVAYKIVDKFLHFINRTK